MPQQRLELLREALPYIRRFKGKIFVLKLGGWVTDDPRNLKSVAAEIALLDQVGFRVVVIHGGGKQLSDLAGKLGHTQTVVQGRRVTDTPTLDIAKMVFSGKVNTDILAVLRGLGVRPVGLSGLDGNIIHASRREIQKVTDAETGRERWVDFGHVGDIVSIDDHLLRLLIKEGYVPVISSLGADEEGNVYNINADTIAAEIAAHLQAEKLIIMSNVDGLYRNAQDPTTQLSHISRTQLDELLDKGVFKAGMIPKLAAVKSFLHRGGKSAHIINGCRRNALLQEVFTDEGTGTMLGGGD